jgi:penicillin amidase
MQGDNRMLVAEDVLPVLMEVPLEGEALQESRDILSSWDHQMDIDSAPGALFAVFWKHLLSATFEDDLPESYWPTGGGNWMEITRKLIEDPTSPWWDDRTTDEIESREEIFSQAFENAVAEIQNLQGKDPEGWSWGDLHTITFENAVMSSFPIIKNVFNRGPFPTAGGSAIVNATGWNTSQGYQVGSVPSMRMIVDLSDLSNSLTMHTTGQSGHPYHSNYIDMADPWRLIQYYPMYWDLEDIETNASGRLTLIPQE